MQVAVLLCYLSDEGHYRKIGNTFGLTKSTVSIIVHDVAFYVTNGVGPQYTKLPSTNAETNHSVEQFLNKFGIPQCSGAADGTHVGLKQPQENPANYTTSKTYYIQASCDRRYCFTDVVIQ